MEKAFLEHASQVCRKVSVMKNTIILGLLLVGLGGLPAHGIMQTWTWNGGGADANWTTISNWTATLPGTAPQPGGVEEFGGSVSLSPNNNEVNLSSIGIIFKPGAGAFTLTGNGISMGGASGIANDSTSTETIDLPLTLAAPQQFSATSGPLVFSGTIDGAYNLTLSGPNSITLTGAVGSIMALNSLTASGGPITIGPSIIASGNLGFSPTETINMAFDTVLHSTASGVTVGPLQGNGHTLTVTAAITTVLNGGSGLANLSIGSPLIVPSGTVQASGIIDVTVAPASTVSLGGDTYLTTSTLALSPVQGNGHSLTAIASGPVTIPGGSGLANLTVAASALTMSGTLQGSGNVDLSQSSTVQLGGETLVTSGTGNVNFGATPVQGNNRDLVVMTSGMTTLNGGASHLGNLKVGGGGAVSMGGTVSGTGKADLTQARELNLSGDSFIIFNTLSNAVIVGYDHSLMLEGPNTVTLNGASGLANLTVAGGLVAIEGTASASGNLNFGPSGEVSLSGNTWMSSTGGGAISLPAVQGNLENLTIDTSGMVTFDGELDGVSTLDVIGSVVNNSILQAPSGTTLEFFGPVINYGVINALYGNVAFYSSVMNYGTIITSNCPPIITSIQVVGLNVEITFTTCSNVPYEVDYDTNLVSGTWTPLTNLTASGSITSVTDPGAAVLPQRFYRAGLVDTYQQP